MFHISFTVLKTGSDILHRCLTELHDQPCDQSSRLSACIHTFPIIPLLVFRCLMDSGGGMPPGSHPGPCPSTSAPSLPLPRAQTWTAAASIQSEGKSVPGINISGLHHPGKCMKYSLGFIKTPPSLVPEDFINPQSFAWNTRCPNYINLLPGCLIDSCVRISSVSTLVSCFLRSCVCGSVSVEGDLLFTVLLSAE